MAGTGPAPHDYVFCHQGSQLATVRDDRWKLHVVAAVDRTFGKPGERWIDPRAPDGVTILAPWEQYQPTDYPGLATGDPTPAGALFDLQNDPGEQKDVSREHPDAAARLRAAYEHLHQQLTSQ
jgi:hypothetical protein